MKKIQRRDFLKAMGLATAALGLTACGGSGAASASSVSSAPRLPAAVPRLHPHSRKQPGRRLPLRGPL